MKILYVVKTNVGAGWAYRQVEWILNNCQGYEFVIVIPEATGGFADKYKELGCRLIPFDTSLPVKKPWAFLTRKRLIEKIILDEKPDVIHSHFVTTTLMLRLALWNSPIKRIFQVPGPLHLENFLFRYIDRITIRTNDYLIGTCSWTTDMYKKLGISDSRVFLNYYGGPIPNVDNSRKKLRIEYNIDKKTPIIGMVSYFYAPKYYLFQFVGLKGHEDFIQAMKIVRSKKPDALGIIVGNAWVNANKYEEKVKQYANRICPEGLIFTGFRDDVLEIYQEMDVAVHPSHSENLGGAAESLLSLVPTVSTNVGGFPDIVKDGITGWTVRRKKPAELAERIIWMIDHPDEARIMANRGRQYCIEILSIEKTAQQMAKIYGTISRN